MRTHHTSPTTCVLHPGEKVPARTITSYTLDGITYAIDLCEQCEKEHLAPAREVLEAYGRTLVPRPRRASRTTTP